jgi:transposase
VPTLKRDIRAELSAPLVADLEAFCAGGVIQALSWKRRRQGHGLFAQALASIHALPSRRARLPLEHRCGSSLRPCSRQKSGLFAGSDRGGQRATSYVQPFVTAKMNDIDPPRFGAPMFSPASRPSNLAPLLP